MLSRAAAADRLRSRIGGRRRSPTGCCSRRWPGSATGSCACRRSRHGAGLAVSEMVSSFALHHRNERTLRELLRIHPDEHPVSIQLFGHDPEVMRSAAAIAAEAGADLIDINMGCPVRKVRKTGAGAELLARSRARAGAGAAAAVEGSGLPVTVKLRSGHRARRPLRLRPRRPPRRGGRRRGDRLPPARGRRPATRAAPDYALVRELVERLADVPVIVSGGLDERRARRAAPTRESGADAVMIARGSLGNPWIFEELTGRRDRAARRARRSSPSCSGSIDRAEEHLGRERARPATCASSTPGTWSGSASAAATPTRFQRSADLRPGASCSPLGGCRERRLSWRSSRVERLAIIPRLARPSERRKPSHSGVFGLREPISGPARVRRRGSERDS